MMRHPMASLFLVLALAFTGMTAEAASKQKIDRLVGEALQSFKEDVKGSATLLAKAEGVLVFPRITKAGLGIGGENGEGALMIGGKTVDYYSTAAGSIGLQLGVQARSQILLFMDKKALKNFRDSSGWEVGVDGSVAVITLGAGGSIDTTNTSAPIIAFIFNNKGLMYNLSLEGSKITKIVRE